MKKFDTDHLAGEQLQIAKIIKKVLGKNASDGGNQTFYDPEAWKERGEKYGHNSLLVLVHDGGDLAPYVNYDYEQYDLCDKLSKQLEKHGFYVEQCTSWYSAVYAIGA